MRVHHFNTDLKGGAATAAKRLHHSLLQQGVDSIFYYHPDHHDDSATSEDRETFESVIPVRRTGIDGLFRKLRDSQRRHDYRKYFANRPAGREIFSTPWQVKKTPFGDNRPCGVVHLHWILSWLDLKSFLGSFPSKQPFVWTLHDMNTITGGCHHADECEKFKSVCQNCPQIDNPGPADLSFRSFKYKQKLFRGRNLHIVTPSRWMENNVRQSALGSLATSVQTIRNGLDLALFQPLEKKQIRKQFSIPLDRRVIGFGAGALSNIRKGFQDLLEALQILSQKNPPGGLTVIVFGLHDIQLPSFPGIEFKSLGYLATPIEQSRAYSAMDVFVLPSWAENMPQTAVESMACGTPVVAYDVGGIPEIVIPGQTGALARHKDPEDLARQLEAVIRNPDSLKAWGQSGRELVIEQFAQAKSCRQYFELYRSVV